MSRPVRLSYGELSQWLDLPVEAVRLKALRRAAEGRWRIVSSEDKEDMIELPAADLNRELDERHDSVAAEEQGAPEPAEEPPARDPELNRLLVDARDAMEAMQERLSLAERERAELARARADADTLRDQLVDTKTRLIAAYDRILDMQHAIASARPDNAFGTPSAADAASILSILDRLRSKTR